MAKHLCYMSNSSRDEKKMLAVMELIASKEEKPARFFKEKLKLKSRQVARLLKRIDCIKRRKKYNRYLYTVDVSPPQKIKVGDREINIEEQEDKDGKYIIIKDDNGLNRKVKR